MSKTWHILLFAIVLLTQLSNQTTLRLPISQRVMTKVSLSIQRLEGLLKTYNTPQQNKMAIYNRVQLTKIYLQELNVELSRHNNVIVGAGNIVSGKKNLVLGNFNNLKGNNNWVFTTKYTGSVNGNLIIGQWRIQLDKSSLILINTKMAISYINEAKNDFLRNKYTTTNRQLVIWDSWTNPTDPMSDSFWNNFLGYGEWKQNFLNNLAYTLDWRLAGFRNFLNTNMMDYYSGIFY